MQSPDLLAAMEDARREDAARRLCADYRHVFQSEAGARVLADLMEHFAPDRPRFSNATGFDPIKAAVCDGQSQVMVHVNFWLRRDDARPKEEPKNIT